MSGIAIITVNFRNVAETLECLDSLAAAGAAAPGFGVFVIENGSGDDSASALAAYAARSPLKLILRPLRENIGFAAGCNLGIEEAFAGGYSHAVLLNNDTLVDPDFPAAVRAAVLARPEAVQAGYIGKLSTGEPAHNLGSIGKWTGLVRFHFPRRGEPAPAFDFISCCLMIIPATVVKKVGALKGDFFLYCEDLEFCLRLKAAGVPLAYDPAIGIRHHVSAAVTRVSFPKEYYRMRNQTWVAMRRLGAFAKAVYLARVAGVLARHAGSPALFRQFRAGIRDGILGRLGRDAGTWA
jgi:GT2 family glycosyltransferase